MDQMEKYLDNKIIKAGRFIGFISAYLILTLSWFLILNSFNRIPENWNVLNIVLITFLITCIGLIIRRVFR